MDTLTLRALWLAAVDAPLAPALGLLTGAGLALLGAGTALAAAAWVRFLLAPGHAPGAGPGGGGISLLAWRTGRQGAGVLAVALGTQAVVLASVSAPDIAAALRCTLAAAALVWARGSWSLWAAVLPQAPVPRPPVASDVRRIAEAITRWDRAAAGGVTTLTPRWRPAGGAGAARPRAPRTHRTPDA